MNTVDLLPIVFSGAVIVILMMNLGYQYLRARKQN